MAILKSVVVPKNSGAAFEVKKRQRLQIAGKSIVDFVAFNLHDLTERFDQARTKTNQVKTRLLGKSERGGETVEYFAGRRAEPVQYISMHAHRSRHRHHVRHDDSPKRRSVCRLPSRNGFTCRRQRMSGVGQGTGDSSGDFRRLRLGAPRSARRVGWFTAEALRTPRWRVWKEKLCALCASAVHAVR